MILILSLSSHRDSVPAHNLLSRFATLQQQVCVFGKPEGAGTGVTLSNTHFAGLGVPIPFDESTGVCGAVTVRGLTPNESYVSWSTGRNATKNDG